MFVIKEKIFGLRRDVVNFITKKIETYLPNFRAGSFEEYEKKYIEYIISLVEESIPTLKIDENFRVVLEEKAREYAEKHFYDDLKRRCFIVPEESIVPHEILKVIGEGTTMEWLKEHKCDSWIDEELIKRYGMGAVQHHAEQVLLRYVEIALKTNFYHVYHR